MLHVGSPSSVLTGWSDIGLPSRVPNEPPGQSWAKPLAGSYECCFSVSICHYAPVFIRTPILLESQKSVAIYWYPVR